MAPTSPRRVSLPAADDLFRPTDPTAEELAAEAHVRAVPDGGAGRPSGRLGSAGRAAACGTTRR